MIGFGEEPERNPDGTLNYTELARIGGMSRVAARKKFAAAADLVLDEPETTAV